MPTTPLAFSPATSWPDPTAGMASGPLPPPPALSPLEHQHPPQRLQRVDVSSELLGQPREQVLARLCAGRRVLHVGCSDWPHTDARHSLLLRLQPHCAQLDGVDEHDLGFDMLAPHLRGRLFPSFEQATDAYDLLLLPDLLDRVPDVGMLLTQVQRLRAPHLAITVPDAYSSMRSHFDHAADADTFFEATHADRLRWFTPYTLTRTVRRFTDWQVKGLWFLDGGSLLMVAGKSG